MYSLAHGTIYRPSRVESEDDKKSCHPSENHSSQFFSAFDSATESLAIGLMKMIDGALT